MKLTSVPLAVLIFILLFGGIGFTSAMNWWQTESKKVPVSYSDGAAAGEYNPADIRGSYTFGDVSELFEIPLDDLQIAFRIPMDVDPAGYELKSLEAQFVDLPVEIGTGSVRLFVAFYKGLPYDLSLAEDTFLLPEAAEIIKAQNKLLPEQAAYLENHIVVVEDGASSLEVTEKESTPLPTQVVGTPIAPEPTEHAAPDKTVTGKTTFQDLLDWGLTQAEIETLLGNPMPSPKILIKDYATQQGEAFSTLKSKIQVEVDRLR